MKLLKWFEKLWVHDGTHFDNFIKAYNDNWERARIHLESDFLHAYILWSSLA